MRLRYPLRSDAVILCCCKAQIPAQRCLPQGSLWPGCWGFLLGMGEAPAPHIASASIGTVALVQAGSRAAFCFVRPIRLSCESFLLNGVLR